MQTAQELLNNFTPLGQIKKRTRTKLMQKTAQHLY